MQSVIISDSSCLIILKNIDQLYVLEKLFGQVLITPEIYDEIGETLPGWIIVRKARDPKYQALINASLDSGESSAIALAAEYENPLLILDDLKARNYAESLNIPYTGTIGVLLDAKKKGIIKNVKEVLGLIERTNFRLSKELIDSVLVLADEK